MKIFSTYFLTILIALLSACAPPPPPNSDTPPIAAQSGRIAVFTELENDIRAHTDADVDPAPAIIGQNLIPGGGAQSGQDSRARLDLAPDGTVIRLGPNSIFTLEELGNDAQNPLTRLQLLGGQLWIILSGGELEVDTPYGIAGVRGSMMSVDFDPDADGLTITCLEGHCSLANEAGEVELTEGLASVISAKGLPPSPPRDITAEERDAWTSISPEADAYLKSEPAPPPPDILPILIETLMPPPPEPAPNEDVPPSSGPLKYNLNNNCPDQVWHWQFEGTVSRSLSIPPGGSASGQLPAGEYYATDWLEGGETHGPDHIHGGWTLEVTACR